MDWLLSPVMVVGCCCQLYGLVIFTSYDGFVIITGYNGLVIVACFDGLMIVACCDGLVIVTCYDRLVIVTCYDGLVIDTSYGLVIVTSYFGLVYDGLVIVTGLLLTYDGLVITTCYDGLVIFPYYDGLVMVAGPGTKTVAQGGPVRNLIPHTRCYGSWSSGMVSRKQKGTKFNKPGATVWCSLCVWLKPVWMSAPNAL